MKVWWVLVAKCFAQQNPGQFVRGCRSVVDYQSSINHLSFSPDITGKMNIFMANYFIFKRQKSTGISSLLWLLRMSKWWAIKIKIKMAEDFKHCQIIFCRSPSNPEAQSTLLQWSIFIWDKEGSFFDQFICPVKLPYCPGLCGIAWYCMDGTTEVSLVLEPLEIWVGALLVCIRPQ